MSVIQAFNVGMIVGAALVVVGFLLAGLFND